MTKYPSFVDHCMHFERSKNLLCFICRKFTTNNNKNQTWETHFTDPLHHLMLEKFNESFYQSSRRNITCKICLESVVKDNVIEHAIEHKLVPWYKSPDVFMIFFFNFIAEIDDQYYCHLCEKKFSFWYSASIHIKNHKHQQYLSNMISKNIKNETHTFTVCQLLISHSIFPKDLQMFECMVCKQGVCGHQNIDEHIKGQCHLENQATFINELLEKQEKKVNNDTSSKNQALSTNNLETNKKNTSSNIFSHVSNVDLKLENEENLPPDLDTKSCVLASTNDMKSGSEKLKNDAESRSNKFESDANVNNENSSKNRVLSMNILETNEENTSSNIFPYASKVDLKLENNENLPPDLDTKLCVLIFDFCTTCATLWFGFQYTLPYHSEYPKHKCFAELPKEARELLTMPERICDDKLAEINRKVGGEKYKEERLMEYLGKIAREKFPNAMIHRFGSRVTGLGSKNSDLDVCIDCTDVVYGHDYSSRILIAWSLAEIEKSLRNYPEIWEIQLTVNERVRVPIIKAYHKPTGIDCDISFSNLLAVENTKLIKSYIETYPFCRKLIIFMKIWIEKCNLYGYKKLTSYAVAWMVIFYLQCENNLQNVDELIALKKQSRLIGVWEVGVIERIKDRSSNQDFMQLLKGLFIFYSKFNYKEEVICPLLGETIKKERFKSLKLPSAMNTYIRYLETNNFGEFRIFSTMCLQDPFDLSHNLTKSVTEFSVHRLKSLCLRTAEILENNF